MLLGNDIDAGCVCMCVSHWSTVFGTLQAHCPSLFTPVWNFSLCTFEMLYENAFKLFFLLRAKAFRRL